MADRVLQRSCASIITFLLIGLKYHSAVARTPSVGLPTVLPSPGCNFHSRAAARMAIPLPRVHGRVIRVHLRERYIKESLLTARSLGV